ncbi:MAG TPA: TonB-dependent receptor, partial [Terriglobales bacterium]
MRSQLRSQVAWVFVLLLALFAATTAVAQTTGRVIGQVTDPSGAVLPDVKVTLVNEQTGASRTAETSKSGDFVLPEVPVGTYRIEFEAQGFKKSIRRNILLQLNQVATVNQVLQLGTAQEVVDVSTEAPLVDTTSTQIGAVVDSHSVTELPLNARDTYQFLQLQPGVQSQLGGSGDLFYGSDRAGAVSVNGGRGRANNFSVNGGDANDQFANLPTVQPSPDSIEEFRVLTNTFDAEYGRNSGAVVNVVTKSGTNRFHGNFYEFFRNKVLNSKGYFDTVKPDFQQNQYGATFGGPIKKDRTFFFVSYEGRRIKQGKSSDTVYTPTAAERVGDFSSEGTFGGYLQDDFVAQVLNSRPGCSAALGGAIPMPSSQGGSIAWSDVFPGSNIPVACMDPVAVDLMNKYMPSPTANLGYWQGVPNGFDHQEQGTVRFDHRITDRQNLSFYYYVTDDALTQPFAFFQAAGANVPGFGSNVGQRFQQYNLSHTWTLTNAIVNEARFAYNREGQRKFQHPQTTNLVTDSCSSGAAAYCFTGTSDASAINDLGANPSFGITPALGASHEGVPFIVIGGGATIGNNFEGELPQVGNSFQWTDNLSWVRGNHTMKFGGDVRRMRFDQTLYYNVNGFYTITGSGNNSIAQQVDSNGQYIPGQVSSLYPDYLLGLSDSYSQGSAQRENVRSTSLYLFAQDSWKISKNLTMNYGLRWELNTPLKDVLGHVQTFRPGQNS